MAQRTTLEQALAAGATAESTVPPRFIIVPPFFLFIRYAQIGLSLIIIALDAYVLSRLTGYFGGAPASTLFLCLLTLLYCGYYIVSSRFLVTIYHPIAILASEVILKIWWLGNWAGSAYWAAIWNGVGWYGYGYGYVDHIGPSMGALAGLGALQWLLFLATMISFLVSWIRQSKQTETAETFASKLEQGYPLQAQAPPAPVPVPQSPYPVEEKQPLVANPIVPQQPPYPTETFSQAPYPTGAASQHPYPVEAPSQPHHPTSATSHPYTAEIGTTELAHK